MKIWYLVAANGDGSATVHFFQSQQVADAALTNEKNLATYGCNESGAQSFEINPDGTTTLQFTDEKVAA